MAKKVLIIEDLPGDFKAIHRICTTNSCVCYPSDNLTVFNDFLDKMLAFLNNSYNNLDTKSSEKAILDTLGEFKPDLIICDYGLLDTQEYIDDTGGEFRATFIEKYFPNVPVLFFSVYSKEVVSKHMQTTDSFLSKIKEDGLIFDSWEKKLQDFIINQFQNG